MRSLISSISLSDILLGCWLPVLLSLRCSHASFDLSGLSQFMVIQTCGRCCFLVISLMVMRT